MEQSERKALKYLLSKTGENLKYEKKIELVKTHRKKNNDNNIKKRRNKRKEIYTWLKYLNKEHQDIHY